MSFKTDLQNHKLEVICDTPKVKCFRLYEKLDSNHMSTYFTFLPSGISISGNLTPSEIADFCPFKTLDWFIGDLSEGYLVEKFRIKKIYNPRATKQNYLDSLEVGQEPEDIDWDDIGQVCETLNYDIESIVYSPEAYETELLVALQEAFKRESTGEKHD